MDEETIQLLVVEDSVNAAHQMASLLRNAGHPAEAHYAEDIEDLRDLVESETIDVVLCPASDPDLDPEALFEALGRASFAIPAIALEDGEVDRAALLRQGFRDVVARDSENLLSQVVLREVGVARGRRAHRQCRDLLTESEKRSQVLVESSRDAVAYIHGGMHVFTNQAYLDLVGRETFEEIEGLPLMDLIGPEDRDRFKRFLKDFQRGKTDTNVVETELLSPADGAVPATFELSPASIEGEPCLQVVIRRQTETRELEKQIEYLSQRDLLTGLYNREYFLKRLDEAIEDKEDDTALPSPLLLQIQLDRVDQIREQVGLAGVDQVVTEVGKMLEKETGDEEIIARYSGYGFAILAPGDERDIDEYARGLNLAIARHIAEVRDASVTTTASIGIVPIDAGVPDANEALNRAERASLEAQNQGGNTFRVYQPKEGELTQKEEDEEWMRRIRDALTQDRFKLAYQPIVALSGGNGDQRFEAFIRMLQRDGGVVPPMDFVPAAERTGIAHAIDRWVILNALKEIARARKRGQDLHLYLQLSSNSLNDEELASWLSDRLAALRVKPASLTMELHESKVSGNLVAAKDLVRRLRQTGCGVILDEFGMGINPFQLLEHLEVDAIKIDRNFMRDIGTNTKNQETLQSMIDEIRRLGYPVMVPNVEDAATLSTLWTSGVQYVQGEFLQEPMDSPEYDFGALMAG